MPAIITTIINLFGFFKWERFINYAFRAITFSKMVIINGILTTLVLSYAVSVIYIINFIYSKFNYIIDYVNNLSVGNEKIVTTAFSILKSLGAWGAFCDVFSIFSPIFLSFFIIYATKIGITVFRFVRETLVTFILAKL
ncbi:hypothetical protein [Campylobacter concisus]|uniref:hypothetical protein n=1 Tax=Campylobacter concisus TaxID=199 RepID=UPI00142EA525|nr:hypothetical protein [Campylobacter concisus]